MTPSRTVRQLAPAALLGAVLSLVPGPGATGVAHAQRVPAPAGPPESPAGERPFVASPYLPLDHPAVPVLDRWIARGWIDGLSPLTRPWRTADVRRALGGLPDDSLPAPDLRWRDRLLASLAGDGEARAVPSRSEERPEGGAYLRGRFSAGGVYRSQLHRDLLRPRLEGPGSGAKLLERLFVEADGRAGPVVAAFRAGRDGYYTEDPQFPDGRVVPETRLPPFDEAKLRVEEAYVGLQSRYAEVTLGRVYRNWGPPGGRGLLRSDYAYSWDELAFRVGTDRLSLSGTFAPLGDFARDTARWYSAHRLEARPWPELLVAVTEAAIHGGPSEPLDVTFVNPLGVWHLSQGGDGTPPVNVMGEVEVWWRASPRLVLYGTLLADATNAPEGSDESCCQMGGTLGLELPALLPATTLRLRATAIQSLAYRTGLPWEEWSVRGLGIGRDKADLYLLTAEGVWTGRPGLVARPRIEVQLRGEASDYHGRLRPSAGELPTFPRILAGETETTVRVAVAGRWRPVAARPLRLELGWDLGVDLIDDYRHVPGDDRSAFVGTVELRASTPWIRLPLE